MSYWIAAHLVVALHFGFVFFVVFGGFMVWWWRWVGVLHIPAALWGALIEFQGWMCPLTPLEQRFREAAGQAGYSGGFIEYYLPVLYPSSLSWEMQIALGTVVLVINVVAYGWLIGRGRQP